MTDAWDTVVFPDLTGRRASAAMSRREKDAFCIKFATAHAVTLMWAAFRTKANVSLLRAIYPDAPDILDLDDLRVLTVVTSVLMLHETYIPFNQLYDEVDEVLKCVNEVMPPYEDRPIKTHTATSTTTTAGM
jgi:hypothetical protein